MAEIGLIASIAGVTAIAVALSKTLYEAIQDTANAPESVRALDKEIRITCLMLNGLLQSLRDGAEDRPEMPEIIDQLRQDLGRLSEIVKRHLPVKGNAAQQVWNQFVWMTKTREVARLRASIKSYRTLLSESVIVNSRCVYIPVGSPVRADQVDAVPNWRPCRETWQSANKTASIQRLYARTTSLGCPATNTEP